MGEVVQIGDATLYHGDCLEILPTLPKVGAVVTDPPYPNRAGHFLDNVCSAERVLASPIAATVVAFWDHMEFPACALPRVAVHVWHRTNVNGTPYEAIHHFHADGKKRRSDVIAHAAVFDGVGPGCWEFAGHPTQKPVALMERLVGKTEGAVCDPFMGSGTTGVACANLGRKFIGIEIERKYFDMACERIDNAYRQKRMFA